MQSKYAKDGFAAVSVSLDDPNDKKAKDRVIKFLESKKATFTNLILDEKPEVWQEKLKIDGPPAVFVFGRDGKLVKKFAEGVEGAEHVDYAKIEQLVTELLKKK
jgi:hypothetical protein